MIQKSLVLFTLISSLSFFSWAENQNNFLNDNEQETLLKRQLHQDQIKEWNEEVEGQNYFIVDWNKYSQEVQKIKATKEDERKINQQIQELEQNKQSSIEKNRKAV